MTTIAKIQAKFEQRADVLLEVQATSITVSRGDGRGFPVTLRTLGGEYVVLFGGWHEHFDQEDEALSCFAFGLSGDCRLVTTYRGRFAVKWTVEYREGGAWREDSSTGLLLTPFWLRKRTEHASNALDASTPQIRGD